MQHLYSRLFDLLDSNWSGTLDEKEVNGFCTAMIQGVATGSAEWTSLGVGLRSAKACVAALVGKSRAVAKIDLNSRSMTRRQFCETEPSDSVRVKVEPYYADILVLCQKLLTVPQLAAK
jgi:hypothetical protein